MVDYLPITTYIRLESTFKTLAATMMPTKKLSLTSFSNVTMPAFSGTN